MTLPKDNWETVPSDEAGFDPDRLNKAKVWLDEHVEDRKYRFAIVRGGKLVVEWNHRVERDEKLAIASTWKSMLSNVLGIAVAEGKLSSVDAEVYDYWPEYMDVPEGTGPKDGRYAFPKDRQITFRQLISNTSGYMKPGEEPGTVFHYQSWGMNILSHAVAHLYGYYDAQDPEKSDGCMRLMREKLAEPLGAAWAFSSGAMDLQPLARQNIFGYGTRISTTALDLARAGWLWCNYGRWGDAQLVPEAWMRDSTQVAQHIKAHCLEKDWLYGNVLEQLQGHDLARVAAQRLSFVGCRRSLHRRVPRRGTGDRAKPGSARGARWRRGQSGANRTGFRGLRLDTDKQGLSAVDCALQSVSPARSRCQSLRPP